MPFRFIMAFEIINYIFDLGIRHLPTQAFKGIKQNSKTIEIDLFFFFSRDGF
jgi:hypothetical protein